jgi:hypothetical protein
MSRMALGPTVSDQMGTGKSFFMEKSLSTSFIYDLEVYRSQKLSVVLGPFESLLFVFQLPHYAAYVR